MKRAYGAYSYQPRRVAEMKSVDVWDKCIAIGGRSNLDGLVETDAAFTVLAHTMDNMARNGDCLHVFFKGTGFYEWLSSVSPPYNDEMYSVVKMACKASEKTTTMFHFSGGDKPTILFMPDHLCENSVFFCTGYKGVFGCLTGAADDVEVNKWAEDSPPELIKNLSSPRLESKRIKDLLCGCAAYISAFPDMVLNGIPDDLKQPNHYRKALCKSVAIADKLVIRGGLSPHYRVGHFRLLKSERYKNKRGQVVFVHGCFVKGKAETVLSPEEEIVEKSA